jgi:hypothetical protein
LESDRGRADFDVAIHGQGVDISEEVKCLVGDRLRRDLRAFAGRIIVARVRLWSPPDANAPVTCQVRVELRPSGGLALGETCSSLATALDRATRRMKAALAAQLPSPGEALAHAWLR